ncbi:MAG: hypothetical protein J5661_02265 [Bacteroidaceae bacterium]|nr:hypothetical protein [Bacteroidaceae bacterium]
MKKMYTEPQMIEADLIEMSMLAGSRGVTSNNGIKYGGVDTDGSKDPSVKGDTGWFDYE